MKRIAGAFLILLGVSAYAQENESNVFHDRKYWKENPSIKDVKQKIAEGNSPTALTEYNFDAIGYAILEKAPLKTIKFLLEQGNDVNKLTHDARTYIFWAAYKGDLKLMKYLTDQGADPTIIDQHGNSLFMFAAVTGQEDKAIYEYIIELGADVKNDRDRSGRNALIAYTGGMKTGKLLDYFIEKGLDIHAVDKNGNGAFHHAAKTGSKELLETLVEEYMVSTEKNSETNENAIFFASTRYSASEEQTPLAFYEYLEGFGLDPAVVTSSGKTALHNISYRTNDLEIFNYFMDKGADPDQVDEEGNIALINAASRRNMEVMQLLVENTANINHVNKQGYSAFTRALKYNKLEIAKMLQEKGAKTDIVDASGYDLGYHLVDSYRNTKAFTEKLDYLKSLGYDPLSKQQDGSTLLHAAVNKEKMELIEMLVEMGIDVNAKDASGQTVLHYAAMQADDETMLKYLVEVGADKTVTTEFEESAYELAQANEVLKEKQADLEFLKESLK
ncbi:MAG: ankyrin repeat domain-containing protein [Bacteroidota bacterium]